MNINQLRKLNEELDRVLNEISYETAEKVYNARNQQAHDAIIKMDRAEKFMKNRRPDKELLQQVLDGTYQVRTYDDRDRLLLSDIVLPYINELTVDQLVDILENRNYNNDHSLFPSSWKYNRDKKDYYPAKLAQALSESNASENISDIYNVFYANMDKSLFKEAIPVWQEAALVNNPNNMDIMGNLKEYPDQLEEVLDTLRERYPEFVDKLVAIYDLPDKTEYEV